MHAPHDATQALAAAQKNMPFAHTHFPLVHIALAPHTAHAPPPVPHAIVVLPAWHMFIAQQPFGHDVWVHMQTPFTHCCPAAHAGPAPHLHVPLVQESAVTFEQAMQATPPIPQVASDGISHALPAQQPFAQLLTLQLEHF